MRYFPRSVRPTSVGRASSSASSFFSLTTAGQKHTRRTFRRPLGARLSVQSRRGSAMSKDSGKSLAFTVEADGKVATAPRGMSFKLVVVAGPDEGKKVPLD